MKRIKTIFVLLMVIVLAVGLISMSGCGKDDKTTGAGVSVAEEVSAADEISVQGDVIQESEDETEEAVEEEVFVMPEFDDSKAESAWTTSDVKFRTEPNTDCDVIKVLKKGTEVKSCKVETGVTGTGSEGTGEVKAKPSEIPEGWAFVKIDDTLGFVSEDYLTGEEPKEEEQTAKVEAIPGQHRDPNNIVVCIDPGHQGKGDSTKEPNGPGSSTMKARVTSGTEGEATGVAEYVMNLEIGLMLREELENRGYTVYMTRTTHDVNISNMERAQYSSQVGADIAIRIHCNSVDNSSVRGAETMAPSTDNQYVGYLAKASQSLSRCVIDAYCEATGFKNRGVQITDTMTGINWSEIPVTIIELGFMSNPEEDQLMQDANMKNNMVQGMADGIDDYFGMD